LDVVHLPATGVLGRSPTAKFYGLSGEEEARAYLAHPLLGPRYRECVAAVKAQLDAGNSLEAIFGELDAMKFRSSVEVCPWPVIQCLGAEPRLK
jgi:uncharacterized protein (DUF1810 family)